MYIDTRASSLAWCVAHQGSDKSKQDTNECRAEKHDQKVPNGAKDQGRHRHASLPLVLLCIQHRPAWLARAGTEWYTQPITKQYVCVWSDTSVRGWTSLLCHDNGHGIIQHTLPKDKHVKGGVDVQSMEDGQSGHWVYCRDEAPKGKTAGRGGVRPRYNT